MQRLASIVRLAVHTVRRRGVRGTWGRLVRLARSAAAERTRRQADHAFDRALGTDTARWVRVPDLATESANVSFAVRYQPSSVEEFEFVMGKLDVDPRDFVFVDYGSGKGKVLVLAAAYPFKRIVGVEFSAPLDSIARRNLAGIDAAERVETVVMDAEQYEPPDEPLVLYFFNPFARPVLERVLERVNSSLDRRPRPAYALVIGPPDFADAIASGGFEPLDVERLGWLTRGVFVAHERPPRTGR